MALITLHRSPSGSGRSTPTASKDEESLRRSRFQRRHSFVMVKGAALLLQEEEEEPVRSLVGTPALHKTHKRNKSAQDQDQQQRGHLQAMVDLLRPQDSIKLAVRLESAKLHRIRYLLVVSTMGCAGEDETILLGVDFPSDGCNLCTIGMVLPVWSNTQVFLDGDGGFSVTSDGDTRIFKPISVQTMWSMMQVLHKACEFAFHHNHFPASSAMGWVQHYQAAISSEQSCINEWMAMSDLLSVRPDSPSNFTDQPSEREIAEPTVKAKLREVMMTTDLETITSKEIRNELERRMNCNLKDYKEFIDNEMMMILAQMDRPSRIFDYLYLGSEWNASNLEELQKNGVGYILNVTREIDNFFPESLKYLNVRVYDEETTDLLPHWKETYRFISAAWKQNSRVLVHCKMGVSRSASTVIAYAMKEYGWSLEEALKHVKEKRSIVNPNPGFMKQLLIYQGILDASKQRHNDLWELKTKREQLGSSACQLQEGLGGLTQETPQSHDKPSPIEEEEASTSEESEEEEEELPKTPAYCFRPLEGLEEELDFLAVASPGGDAEERPSATLDEEAQPAISVQRMEEEDDEVGSASDDSLAEEVMGHLVGPQPGQESAVLPSSLAVPESPLTPRRQRINLWSVMRSISAMEDLETPPRSPAENASSNYTLRSPAENANSNTLLSPAENANNSNNMPQEVFHPSRNESPFGPKPPLTDGPPQTNSLENKNEGQLQNAAPKSRGKKRLPRQSRAQMDKEAGAQPHRPHSAAKSLARQKLMDKKLSKQVSYLPQAGKVRKQARVLDRLRHHPQGVGEADWQNCNWAGETVDGDAAPAPRPRLKHLQSVAELRKAALVSRQTKAFESGQRPLLVKSRDGHADSVLLPGLADGDLLPALQGYMSPDPVFPDPGSDGEEKPPTAPRLERSMSGPRKMVRWENVEGEETLLEVAQGSTGQDFSHKNGAS